LPAAEVAFGDLPKVDEYSFDKLGWPTVRTVVEHLRRMSDVDPSHPVILEPCKRVMDGMHRVARALLEGRMAIRSGGSGNSGKRTIAAAIPVSFRTDVADRPSTPYSR
jgi:hypothetical protein